MRAALLVALLVLPGCSAFMAGYDEGVAKAQRRALEERLATEQATMAAADMAAVDDDRAVQPLASLPSSQAPATQGFWSWYGNGIANGVRQYGIVGGLFGLVGLGPDNAAGATLSKVTVQASQGVSRAIGQAPPYGYSSGYASDEMIWLERQEQAESLRRWQIEQNQRLQDQIEIQQIAPWQPYRP